MTSNSRSSYASWNSGCYSDYSQHDMVLPELYIGCLSRFQMLASMLSPSDSICSGGGTNGGSDGGSGLDLLRDEDGNFDESSRCR
ncbi:hypothetical protein Tco_0347457 [Tanacetum coccineum]